MEPPTKDKRAHTTPSFCDMEPPTKRKRIHTPPVEGPREMPEEREKPFLRRSQDYYIPDGNIVLAAEDVAFRVHKSQLARHSAIFHDIFTLGSPHLDTSETFDGLSVVRLHDTPNDVLGLLQSVYDFPSYHKKGNIQELASILRMSSKYLLDTIRATVLDGLQTFYPDNLAQWRLAPQDKQNPNEIAVALKLAYDAAAEVLLPAAYYNLCNFSINVVLPLNLPGDVIATYCRGKEDIASKLADFQERKVISRVRAFSPCMAIDCQGAWMSVSYTIDSMLRNSTNSVRRANPLDALCLISGLDCMMVACVNCRVEFKYIIEEECSTIWRSLPAIFGLGSWEMVKAKSEIPQ